MESAAVMHGHTDHRDWQLVSAACAFLARSLAYPNDRLATFVASGSWDEAASELAQMTGLTAELPASGLEGQPKDALHRLRVEATRLFVGEKLPEVNPCEGASLSTPSDGRTALAFVNRSALAVERFAADCGLGRPAGTNEQLDSIATEFELLSHLAALADGAAESGDCPTMPGGSPAAAFDLFFGEHLSRWAPAFAKALAEAAREPYYVAAAQLLAGLVASLKLVA